MKKARKKRIVRRKRRISEREIMRIKRKLKKSARKLRLGAKRTGAYVYGTLRRIVGNPAIPAHMGNPEFVREFRIAEMRARVSGEPVGLYAYRTKGGWGFITRKQSMYRPPDEELVVLFGEKRGLRGNRRRIAGRRRIVRVLGYDVVEGSKKHMRLLAQKRHFDDLQRSERGLRGNPFEPDKIMKLRRILADRQYAKIDGQVVDGVTARAILMVYDGLNEKNRARYSAMPIVKMANIAWKLVR